MVRENPGEYYESKLQIRPYDEKVLDYIKKRIKGRNDVSIVKEVKLKTGVDLYLTSNKFALILGKQLKTTFKGELKTSKKLYSVSRMTSKKLYRVTVCFRLKKLDDNQVNN